MTGQRAEIVDVVKATRRGPSISLVVPIELCRRLGIKPGDRFAVYLTWNDEAQTEAILYVPVGRDHGHEPRRACDQPKPSLACDGGSPEPDVGQECYTCSTSRPAEGLKRALQALKESFEKAGIKVVIFEDAVEALAGKPEVSHVELEELAAKRYPGLPRPLAIARAMNDLWVLRAVRPVKGLMWGGVHEENIPDIIAKLVKAMYEGPHAPIRAITVRIEVEDPLCEDYTHFWIEIMDVEGPGEVKDEPLELDS